MRRRISEHDPATLALTSPPAVVIPEAADRLPQAEALSRPFPKGVLCPLRRNAPASQCRYRHALAGGTFATSAPKPLRKISPLVTRVLPGAS